MLAFYHSLPQGFYFGFLAHYTNYLMILMIVSAGFYIYSVLHPEEYLLYVPFLPIFIGIWSSVFMVMWSRREKELAYSFDSIEDEFDKPQRENYFGKVKLQDVTNKIVKAENGKIIFRRLLADIFMLGSGGVIIYYIYRMIILMNSKVVEDFSLTQEQMNLRLFWIGIINGALNFVLAQTYDFIAELLVSWENHP
jgi:hypothetical protein